MICFGSHIDGFIVVVVDTHVLQQGARREANVIAAAKTAVEVALGLVTLGKKVFYLTFH